MLGLYVDKDAFRFNLARITCQLAIFGVDPFTSDHIKLPQVRRACKNISFQRSLAKRLVLVRTLSVIRSKPATFRVHNDDISPIYSEL
jgi:hypothetical protein